MPCCAAVKAPIFNTECHIDFQIAATALVKWESGVGFDGDFSFEKTYFNTAVGLCLWTEIKSEVSDFWDNIVSNWLNDAVEYLTDAVKAVWSKLWGDVDEFGVCNRISGAGECIVGRRRLGWGFKMPSFSSVVRSVGSVLDGAQKGFEKIVDVACPKVCMQGTDCEPDEDDGCSGVCLCGTGGLNACACRPSANCGEGTANAGWKFGPGGTDADGKPLSPAPPPCAGTGRRRVLASAHHLNESRLNRTAPLTELGRKLRQQMRDLKAKRQKNHNSKIPPPPIDVPSMEELLAEECVEWQVKTEHAKQCIRYKDRFSRIRAATKRLQMVLDHPDTDSLFELNQDGDVPERRAYSLKGWDEFSARRRNRRRRLKWGLSSIGEMTKDWANCTMANIYMIIICLCMQH